MKKARRMGGLENGRWLAYWACGLPWYRLVLESLDYHFINALSETAKLIMCSALP
ncbi:MAG: hypothetical protein I8H71_11320 [Xanthomonadaceae bacterium]|nr:hypothetical protein [Xanthomonadaceae bacterium]